MREEGDFKVLAAAEGTKFETSSALVVIVMAAMTMMMLMTLTIVMLTIIKMTDEVLR